MLESPKIVRATAQPAAVIRLTVPRSEIRSVMEPGHHEILSTLEAQGVAPAGPWFTHHLKMDPAVFDFEIGVPVSGAVAPAGRVRAGELPAGTVARVVYRGPYEGLPAAWGEFTSWVEREGHTPRADLWERYVVGPEAEPDPANWRTELNRPLARRAP